jgi:hypothetical protein
MAVAERHLRLMDSATGEIIPDHEIDDCPKCMSSKMEIVQLRRQLVALQGVELQLTLTEKDLRKSRGMINILQKQLTQDLQSGDHADTINRIFNMWKQWCRHPRSPLDNDRADHIRKILMVKTDDGELAYTARDCALAILGAAAAPYVSTGAGGRKRHDGIDLIFRNASKFEDFVNRGARYLRAHPEHVNKFEEALHA